jgi:hypothetical protein
MPGGITTLQTHTTGQPALLGALALTGNFILRRVFTIFYIIEFISLAKFT